MALAAISAGISALSGLASLFGGSSQNARARAEQDRILREKQDEYDRLMKENYVDTAEAQAVLNQASEDKDKQLRRAQATAALSGQTNEAQLASTNAINKNYSNIIRQIASGATAYKNRIRDKFDQWKRMAYGQQDSYAQSGNNLTTSGLNSLMGAAGTFAGLIGGDSAKANALRESFKQPLEEMKKSVATPIKLNLS